MKSFGSTDRFPSAVTAWTALGVLFLVGVFSATDQTLIVLLNEAIKSDLKLSDVQISLVQGAAFGFVYASAVIPLGRLVDRRIRIRILIASTAIWSAATVATALTTNFGGIVVTRMVTGLGSAAIVPSALSLVADFFRPKRRATATGIFASGQTLGAALAFILGGAVYKAAQSPLAFGGFFASLAPWRTVYFVFAVPGLLLCLILLLIREPQRQEIAYDRIGLCAAAKELWTLRAFLFPLYAGLAANAVAEQAGIAWIAPVLIRNYHQSTANFTPWLGILVLLCGTAGALLGGAGAQAGLRAPWRGSILTASVAGTAMSIVATFYGTTPSLTYLVPLFGLLLVSAISATIAAVSSITLYVPNEIRGLAIGIYGLLVAAFGLGLAPTAVALAARALGGDHQVGHAVALIGAPAAALAVISFLTAMRRAPNLAANPNPLIATPLASPSKG